MVVPSWHESLSMLALRHVLGKHRPTIQEYTMERTVPLTPADCLPADGCAGTLVGRAWLPGATGGPAVVAVRDQGVFDLSDTVATMSGLIERDDPAALVRRTAGRRIGALDDILANTARMRRDPEVPWLMAPCDLQVLKAAGVTFAASLLERVIEERAGGDPDKALEIRGRVQDAIGSDLKAVRPGSAQAMQLKALLVEQGMWSQYLEVGIGPDAEVFTKAPVLAAVGTGVEIGIHPASAWNNPEPEIVLAVDSRGRIAGAALGNDVNLRDVEGRSALLLGRAKDNNASCAIGPFIRLLDERFTLDAARRISFETTVEGVDGFTIKHTTHVAEIGRDLADLAAQAHSRYHQYPDGVVLFIGTMFTPLDDRGAPGSGFTHKVGDVVKIAAPDIGTLVNEVVHCHDAEPWTFGAGALMANLARRGVLRG